MTREKAGFAVKNIKILGIGLLVLGFLGCLCSVGQAMDEAQVEKSFVQFQQDWIKKLNTEGKYGEKNMQVEKASGGGAAFIARYDVVKEPKSHQIKKTDQKATPYIGTMQYEISTCTAQGNTAEEARRGPFACEPKSEVTEIFRFTGSKWVY
jgi:hypothetical protein